MEPSSSAKNSDQTPEPATGDPVADEIFRAPFSERTAAQFAEKKPPPPNPGTLAPSDEILLRREALVAALLARFHADQATPAKRRPEDLLDILADSASPSGTTGDAVALAAAEDDQVRPPVVPAEKTPPKAPTSAGPPPLPPTLPAPPSAHKKPGTPEWKVLEPEDRSDPVPHEVCECRRRDGTWNVLAASLRGRLHAHKAMWRDDAYAFDWVHDWTFIALSDGAGSARLARVGAQLACTEALAALRQALAPYRLAANATGIPTQQEQDHLRAALMQAALQARSRLLVEAQKRRCAVRDLNATFLLLVHTPFQGNALVGALQVGDGAVGIYTEDDSCTVLGVADHGHYSSETRFLTDAGIDQQFGQRVHFAVFKKGIRAVAVMSDGVSDDFFPEDKRLLELFTGNPIQELKTKKGEPVWGILHKDRGMVRQPRDGRALLEWLQYEKRGSSDDRTLVLMYRSAKP